MFGYEASMVLRSALAAGARPLPLPLRDTILRIGSFEGIQGPIRFARDGNAERELFLYVIRNGSFESVD